MEQVQWVTMHVGTHGGNYVPNVALILMAIFVCGCIKLCIESKHHYLLSSTCPWCCEGWICHCCRIMCQSARHWYSPRDIAAERRHLGTDV